MAIRAAAQERIASGVQRKIGARTIARFDGEISVQECKHSEG
jgi:hypothetical protein